MPTGFPDKLRLASEYVRFRFHARSRYRIHSPFLFEMVNEVFRDDRLYYSFDEIERIRLELLSDKTGICEGHHGASSKSLNGIRRVNDVIRTAALPAEYGRLLFRLVNYVHPSCILELGAGAGISTLYLASAATSVPVITLEGSTVLSKIAQEQFSAMHLENVEVMTGPFSETLPQSLKQFRQPGFIFIDGDHRKESLLNYFNQCSEVISANAVIVIDDIYWSQGMKEAWNEIISLPQVTMSIDLFRMGVLFFREGMKKQHLKVVY